MAENVQKQSLFVWEGTDKRGAKVIGETKSISLSLVKAELRRQGINPTKIKKKSAALFGQKKKKITAGDIAVFSRQMSTMMAAGVPWFSRSISSEKVTRIRQCRN